MMMMMMRSASGILLGMALTVAAFAQNRPGACRSDLQVALGGSIVIGCGAQTEGFTYEWTSRDPSWLTYLSDVRIASPRFHAPVDAEIPQQLVYDRLAFDGEGELMHQVTVMITLQEDEWSESGELEDRRLGELEWADLDGLGPRGIRAESTDGLVGAMPDEVPFLRCESRITVDSGELVKIPCTGLHPSGGLLAYRVEFDWPPYNETKILGEGTFAYLVRAPAIQGAASVQVLEVFAQVPGSGQEISERVEVHIVNRAPRLLCEDITVDEGVQTAIPCSVIPRKAARIQLLSELVPRGIHDHWPMIAIPEVHRDTSFSVMVRVFGSEGDSVVEDEFMVKVQDTRTPLDVDVTCNVDPYPLPYVEYEGAGPAELTISCGLTDVPEGPLVWSLSAEGENTPIEPLSQIIDIFENRQTNEFNFVVSLLQEVDGNVVWQYGVLVTENTDDGEEFTDQEEINITTLERPDISILCEDVQVRTGDPPLELKCTPSLDIPHRDAPLDYTWDWKSENGLDLLAGDLNSATPVFDVPEDQDLPIVEYTYQVTASAENTDPPQNPATLTVTVEKNLGKLVLGCTSPVELYAGEPEFPLECAISGDDVPDLSWTWQLQEGPEDRLIAGASGAPPIFRTPGSVEETETYEYEIRVDARFYDASEPESVEIIVLQRPMLSIDCESVRVRTGDPPLELKCTPSLDIPHRDAPLDYTWDWKSENGLDLLSGDLSSATPVFNVPADQNPPTVEYTYQVTASAENTDPPQNPATLTVTVEKYPILLECPEEVVVTVGMPPQRIECSATSDQDVALEYVWQWTPTERLLDTSTGSPLFDVPTRQRLYSRTYPYMVTVSAERAISAQASVSVIVLDPSQGLVEQVEVSSSELDFGMAGPDGEVLMDPATEQLSGLVYEVGQSHAGRMMIRARDSVTVSMEQLQSAVLRHVDSDHELTLVPRIAYSPSCTMFAAYTQASRNVQTLLAPGDCHVVRIGGSITLSQADPGVYSGKVPVVLTVNGLDQLHTIPVVLTVEPQRRVVQLGPDGVRFRVAPSTGAPLEWEQRISIQPQVAVLGPQTRAGTFELTNPSIYPMEVEVSTEFGYREVREEEQFSVGVTDQEIAQGDLSALMTVHPKIMLLSPGETRPVHYAIPDHVQMQARGYAGQFNFTVTPREFIDQRQSPISVRAARITFRAPGVYIPGSAPARLRASVESSTSEAVVLLVETDTIPFYGEVIVHDDSGDELGRSEVLVYTRSRVRVPLDAAPAGGLMLRFISSTPNQPSSSDVYIPSDS